MKAIPKKGFLIILFVVVMPIALMAQGEFSELTLLKNPAESIDAEDNKVALIQKLQQVEDSYGIRIFYLSNIVNGKYVSNIKIGSSSEKNHEAILGELLEPHNMRFGKIADGSYVVLEQESPKGQEVAAEIVRGRVTDAESGETLPGVNVVVKGTTIGVSTDSDGRYELDVPADRDTLMFSFIGYQTREVAIEGRTTINIVMTPEVIEGEELVVVGYGRQSEITTTGSIGTVSSEDIERTSASNIGSAISGKTPGISTVQVSGQPGVSDPDLYLRGLGTMNNNDPLIIIDGIPSTQRSFMQLNPSNISNLSILKDASATAVYGVRGANGVIIVETKRGQVGNTEISADISYGAELPTNVPDYTNSYQWAQLYNQSHINDGNAAPIPDRVVEHYRKQDQPLIYPSNDWHNELFNNTAINKRANLNVSGGSDNAQYFTSLGYYQQSGLLNENVGVDQNFKYDRFNIQANVDLNVTPSTKLRLTSRARVGVRNAPTSNNQFWGWVNAASPMNTAGIVDGKLITVNRDEYQPWASSRDPYVKGLADKGYFQVKENRLNLNLNIRQQMEALSPALKGLEFRTKIGYRSGFNEFLNKNGPSMPRYVGRFNTDVLNPNPQLSDSSVVLIKTQDEGIANWNYGYGANRYIYWEAGLEYKTSIEDHNIGGLLLYNQNKDYYHNLAFSGIPTGNAGMVGRVTYNYDRRYLAEFNLGYNGSENFAKDKRFGWFPSVSAGWVISSESFMQSLEFIDHLKVRASYGLVGSDQAGGNARFIYIGDSYDRNVGNFYGYNFGNTIPEFQPGVHEAVLGNDDVTWETAEKQNYGVNIRLFDDRLTFNGDYFYEHREDILMFRSSAPTWLGAALPAVNIGEVENKGFEVELGWNDQIGDFRYNFSGNFSRARNEILFMDEVPPREPYQTRTGYPLNSSFGYVWDGYYTQEQIDQVQAEELPVPSNYNVQPGDMKYKDLNGDGIIDKADQKVIGYPPQPQISGGFDIGFGYKGFDLNIGLQGAAQVSRNLDYIYQDPFGPPDAHAALVTHYKYAWSQERVDNGSTIKWPRNTFVNDEYNNRMSTFWNRNASYLRVKRAELGYSLNNESAERIGVRRLRIYVRGTNLLTFKHSEIDFLDPERRPGQNSMQHPLMRNFTAGIKIDF